MKKFVLIILSAILFIACEENFSPKADYLPKYSVNCVLRADTTTQIVTVYKSYDVSGLNPLDNTNDPFVKDCFVRMWKNQGNDVFVFKDSSIARDNNSRYNTPFYFYYNDDLSISHNQAIELEILLPTGVRLRSFTKSPSKVVYDYNVSDVDFPPANSDEYVAKWIETEPDLIYAPKAELFYFVQKDGVKELKSASIPLDYINIDGKEIPVYASPDKAKILSIKKSAFDKFLTELSGGQNKANYTIQGAIIRIFIYDRNLSGYYSSTSKIVDQFSVKIDELDFTNIEGGLGVFGSFSSQAFPIRLDKDYIRSFGYKTPN